MTKNNDDGNSLLWEKIKTGDRTALRSLYEMQFKNLLAYGLYICDKSDWVEDAIHDVFVDIYQYRKNLAPNVNIKFYLFSCLRRRLVKLSSRKVTVDIDNLNELDHPSFSTDSSEVFLIRKDTEEQVLLALKNEFNALTEHQKEIMYLRFVQNLSYEEIAKVMSISPSSSRTLLYRSIKILRSKLQFLGLDTLPNVEMSGLKNAIFYIIGGFFILLNL
ncbi:RNA polymerase sigma factor [Anditalea andensis]|uniref:RNA polymerase sigma factor 70 region 4 type 2 domain-containing protein n=1 Tax=Anditalea andensis TaxID=1048983 RepID=A0A074L0V2_9BACT|nr:sigma-70 family RNA polymerase sigma factor [Anditalea andensis]KEO74085.1 hypothetical protein EL17_08040 [Anditalea andensis]